MSWNLEKAKNSLFKIGMNQLAIGKYALGGEFIFESEWGGARQSEDNFRYFIEHKLFWSKNEIDLAVRRITVSITSSRPCDTAAYKEGAKIGGHNGYYSFDKSKALPMENPYPDDIEDHLLWNEGYANAYFSADSDGIDSGD